MNKKERRENKFYLKRETWLAVNRAQVQKTRTPAFAVGVLC